MEKVSFKFGSQTFVTQNLQIKIFLVESELQILEVSSKNLANQNFALLRHAFCTILQNRNNNVCS